MNEEELYRESLAEKIKTIIAILTLLNSVADDQIPENEEFYAALHALVDEDPLHTVISLGSFALGLLGGSGKDVGVELQRLGLGIGLKLD